MSDKEKLLQQLVIEKILRLQVEPPKIIQRMLDTAQIHFQNTGYVLVLIRVFSLSEDFKSAIYMREAVLPEDFININKLMITIFSARLSEIGTVYPVSTAEGIPFLINILPEYVNEDGTYKAELFDDIERIAGEAKRELKSLGIELIVIMTEAVNEIKDLPRIYQEANDLSLFLNTANEQEEKIFSTDAYDDDFKQPGKGLLNRFHSTLQDGRFQESEKLLNAIVNDFFSKNVNSHRTFEFFMTEELSSVINDFSPAIPENIKDMIMKRINELMINYASSTKDGWGKPERICLLVSQIMSVLEENLKIPERFSKQSLEDSVYYIQHHFTDPQFDLSRLCFEFQVKPSTFSKAFKKMTGMTPLSYLQMCRINYAKKLLSTTEENLSEIARNCGYTSAESLILAFKKIEGITPGYYRELNNVAKMS